MAIVPFRNNWLFDPWEEMDKFFDNWPERKSGKFTPAVDVYKSQGNVVVESPLSGVDPEDVDITIEDNVLSIKGKTEKKSEVEEKDYYRKEVRSGRFYRNINLPAKVDESKVKAKYSEGTLKIEAPIKEELDKKKKVKIDVK